ncbi:hypothetical protein LXM94_09735 [Rhizobium sp. TRM95111]|uniref:D-apionate lactonase n=1 Tax=Rhizobium alarense TaxID=2846851 RepID=UPI001F181C91|nr:hypothetical protein [Rhizobium alarense]MCF3640250.1 hypothetical protein [Rhizobium alarense]
MSVSADFLLYGTDEREPEAKPLRAGALSVDLIAGNLRTIRFRDVEVLRAVSFLVRDRDWGTCDAALSDLRATERETGFTVTYTATFTAPDGAILSCRASITGTATWLSFDAEFTPDRDFETARTGFAILHPIVGVAGRAVTVEHGDGSVERTAFPDLIEPWQPLMDIAALTHEPMPGVVAECRMTGDIFEMEDQRNWTDGSYKTYVRPLALPWPYRLKAGETVRQCVTLTLKAGRAAAAVVKAADAVQLSVGDPIGRLPAIGVGLRPDCIEEEQRHVGFLRDVGAARLVAHFDPVAGHGVKDLEGFAGIAAASSLPLTLECFVPCHGDLNEELGAIASQVRDSGAALADIAVSPSVDRQSTPPGSIWPACPPLEDVYAAARKAFPGLPLGGGMFSYFTELNRKRVPERPLDYVTHCTNPIVHAADDLSVMQTFEALSDVVRSLRAIYRDKPYRIGPSTIAMRHNPYGSATKENPFGKRIAMASRDPRHNGLFGAAWTLAYAATVAGSGLDVLTLSTLAGPFGLVAGQGEPMPAGRPRPLFRALKWLGGLEGTPTLATQSSMPQRVKALVAETGEGRVFLLCNVTPYAQTVHLGKGRLSMLDEAWLRSGGGDPAEQAFAGGPLILSAYAVARLAI